MTAYYLILAWLSVRKNPLLTSLMIGAIALGIGVSMTTLTLYHVMSSDPLPQKSDRVFAVQLDTWNPDDPYYERDEGSAPPPQTTTSPASLTPLAYEPKLPSGARSCIPVAAVQRKAEVATPARAARPTTTAPSALTSFAPAKPPPSVPRSTMPPAAVQRNAREDPVDPSEFPTTTSPSALVLVGRASLKPRTPRSSKSAHV